MATCEQIKNAAKNVYPCSDHHFVLSPPVRLVNKSSGKTVFAWLLREEEKTVSLVGLDAAYLVDKYDLAQRQGRIMPEEITDELLAELETLLNRVADEREQDDDSPGSTRTDNAIQARHMLDKLCMERHKPNNII